jgi:hypothetical protein
MLLEVLKQESHSGHLKGRSLVFGQRVNHLDVTVQTAGHLKAHTALSAKIRSLVCVRRLMSFELQPKRNVGSLHMQLLLLH